MLSPTSSDVCIYDSYITKMSTTTAATASPSAAAAAATATTAKKLCLPVGTFDVEDWGYANLPACPLATASQRVLVGVCVLGVGGE